MKRTSPPSTSFQGRETIVVLLWLWAAALAAVALAVVAARMESASVQQSMEVHP